VFGRALVIVASDLCHRCETRTGWQTNVLLPRSYPPNNGGPAWEFLPLLARFSLHFGETKGT
jgi:hypothetical protein